MIDRILNFISVHQTLCGFSLFFGLVRAFCHFSAKIYENWTPFQFKSGLFMGRHVNFGVQSKPTNLTLNFLFRNRQISTMRTFVIYKLARLTATVLYVCVGCRCVPSLRSPPALPPSTPALNLRRRCPIVKLSRSNTMEFLPIVKLVGL